MEVNVHSKNVEVTDDLRQSAARKAERLGRYLAGMERTDVSFSDGRVGHLGGPVTCEVVVEGHGRVIRVVAVGSRPVVALNAAIDKAGIRLTRLKKKLVDRSRPRHATTRSGTGSQSAKAESLTRTDSGTDDGD